MYPVFEPSLLRFQLPDFFFFTAQVFCCQDKLFLWLLLHIIIFLGVLST